jgi:hypothetical protein
MKFIFHDGAGHEAESREISPDALPPNSALAAAARFPRPLDVVGTPFRFLMPEGTLPMHGVALIDELLRRVQVPNSLYDFFQVAKPAAYYLRAVMRRWKFVNTLCLIAHCSWHHHFPRDFTMYCEKPTADVRTSVRFGGGFLIHINGDVRHFEGVMKDELVRCVIESSYTRKAAMTDGHILRHLAPDKPLRRFRRFELVGAFPCGGGASGAHESIVYRRRALFRPEGK